VNDSMGGGMMACMGLDSGAKGMAQLLIDAPVRISRALAREAAMRQWLAQ
jgi:hypothetical protein